MSSSRLLHPPSPRPLRRALALATGSLGLAALLAWTPAITAAWNQSSAESTLWSLTNGDRVNNGVKVIGVNSTLVSIARWRSKDMVVNDYFSHNIPACGGCLVFHYYDINGVQYAWAGENIGWNSGYSDADSPVAINNSFMNSPDHRSNILNPVFTHGGIGAYGADNIVWGGKTRSPRMYTELFMQAKASAPAPAPKPPPKPTPPPAPRPLPAPHTSVPVATPRPTAKPSIAPSATLSAVPPLGALAVLRAGDRWQMPAWVVARDPLARNPVLAGTLVASYRVDAPAPASRSFVETLLGTLLGFFLG